MIWFLLLPQLQIRIVWCESSFPTQNKKILKMATTSCHNLLKKFSTRNPSPLSPSHFGGNFWSLIFWKILYTETGFENFNKVYLLTCCSAWSKKFAKKERLFHLQSSPPPTWGKLLITNMYVKNHHQNWFLKVATYSLVEKLTKKGFSNHLSTSHFGKTSDHSLAATTLLLFCPIIP